MDWQQFNQSNHAVPTSSYAPYYQEDSTLAPNQPNYNYNYEYDDDDERWDDDEENQSYQDQHMYYKSEHQNVDGYMGSLDGAVSSSIHPSNMQPTNTSKIVPGPGTASPLTALAALEHDIQNKAAILKARLLEKRAGSRGANKPGKEELATTFDKKAVDRQESESAIDKLVREARATAEAQAKQKKSPYEEPVLTSNVTENVAQRVSPVRSTPTLTPDTTVQDSSKARKLGPKSSKQAKNTAKGELRAQQLLQKQEAAEQMPKARSNLLANQTASQGVQQTSNDGSIKIKASGLKEAKLKVNDDLANGGQKSPATGSLSHPEILGPNSEKKDSLKVAGAVNLRENIPSRSETMQSTATVQQEPSTALVPVVTSPTQAAADIRQGSVASYSHHFDDLDEWLEVTGYHDRGNKERTLSLHRRKVQLEREMEDIDRELEQTVSFRARSTRVGSSAGRTSSTISATPLLLPAPPRPIDTRAVPPPTAPTGPGDTSAQVGYEAMANTRAGIKRSQRPEGQPESPHADKHRRRNSAGKFTKPNSNDRVGTSSNALEIPLGPRRKDVGTGLKIRGAENGSPDRRIGQGKHNSAHARGRSFNPTSRRGSAIHDRPEPHTLRRRFSTREPSPKRPPAAGHNSRSPVSSTWDRYRPAILEPHWSSGFDQNVSYHGQRFSGSRRGSASQGRFDDNATTKSLALGLHQGGCRYFMIKSWNHENVQAALNEGIWVTQTQNEQPFAQAYRNSRHVIFFFSVNNSKAFQGYARMESLPGFAPEPSWTENLRWPSSPPFYIRWIATAETKFSRVGHLKNILNEGQAVLVGRDGQEIEEGCGAALCEAIDEEAKWSG